MELLKLWKNRKLVLGMNERNLMYVRRYNSGKAKKVADNKLLTKKVLSKAGIPTPRLIGSIASVKDLYEFDWDSLPTSFVIKPVSGLEGGGIEIFYNRDQAGNWIKADGSRYSLEQIKNLAADIIDGRYSLHNQPDMVFFEERIRMHKSFLYYAYKGVPDIRIVVFNSIPVMAMLRLPTKQSDGKGNLQMGAVGCGIDISTGVTTTAVLGKDQEIETIPTTGLSVSGLKIPYWNKILEYAVMAQRATDLNYAGIDFLVDRDKGPMIIELNARPGLSIQIANQDGLRWRLRKARGIKVQSIEKGVRLGKDLFGGSVEEDIERISGKYLVGIYENVTLFPIISSDDIITGAAADNTSKSNTKSQIRTNQDPAEYEVASKGKRKAVKPQYKELTTKAKIDTGADSTSIDLGLARKLGYGKAIDTFEKIVTDFESGDSKHKHSEQSELEVQAGKADTSAAQINEKLTKAGLLDYSCESVRSSHGRSFRLYIPITIELGGYKYLTKANIYDRSNLSYQVIIGRKSLNKFLVEPLKIG
jgi:alpha-L-glutamate ligase-like protein